MSWSGLAQAQILPVVSRNNFVCPGNFPGASFGCTSNDISIASTTVDSGETMCMEGDSISVTVAMQLEQNGSSRYDALVWIGQSGNDPRVAVPLDGSNQPTGEACFVSTLPGFEVGNAGFIDLENGADACNDSANANTPIDQIVGPITVTCADSDNDGQLDLQGLITWQNNSGQANCGDPGADPLTPHPDTGFSLIPNSNNPKCRFGTVNVPVEVRNASLTIVKQYTPGGQDFTFNLSPSIDGTASFILTPTGGNTDEQSFTLAVPDGGTGVQITENTVILPNGIVLDSATCDSGKGDPRNGITLNPGDDVTCTFVNTVQGSVDINKTASPTSVNAADTPVTYTFTLTNDGPVQLTNVGVTDPLPNLGPISCGNTSINNAPFTNGAGTLDPGESVACTATYVFSQDDMNAGGNLVNTATVSGSYPGGTAMDSDGASVAAIQNPSLLLRKAALNEALVSTDSYSFVGEVITYTYDVTNTGNVSLPGPVTVVDNQTAANQPAPVCPAVTTVGNNDGNLDPQETIQCSTTRTITQADLNAGQILNLATASAGGTDSNQDFATIDAQQSRTLGLQKMANPTQYNMVGDIISYSFTVTNTGNVSLAGPVTVNDDQETVTCPAVTTVGNNDANLDPGESVVCTASRTIDQADINAGSVTNVATAAADGVNSGQAQATVTANQNASLALSKSANPTTYAANGDQIVYTYQVQNDGNVSLPGPITVSDDQTAGNQPAPTCPDVSTVGNNDGNLDPGEAISCTATRTISDADLGVDSITNVANASAGQTMSNNSQATINNIQNLELVLDKSADVATYNAVGNVITYSYLVTNQGNAPISNISLNDDQLGAISCPMGTLGAGASMTCEATETIDQMHLDDGSITNIAQASGLGDGQEGEVLSNEDTVTVNAVQRRTISLDKIGAPTTYSAVGDIITYDYTVTNTGNVTLNGPLVVVDDQIAMVTCPDVMEFAPGASVVCQATDTVTQEDIDNGSIINQATATIDGVSSNASTFTVTAVQNRSMSLDKTVMPTTYSQVGDVLAYTFVVTNTGNTTVTGISIDDPLITDATCPLTELAPTESMNCTGSLTVEQSHIDDGNVLNVARANGDSDTQSNQADANATVERGSLSVVKVANGTDQAFQFTSATLGDFEITTTDGAGSQVFPNIVAGDYDIAETVPEGWNLDSATCDNGDDPASITLGNNETVVCTFENSEPTLTATVLTEQCISDTPWVDYALGAENFEPGANPVTIRWYKEDGSNELVEELTGQPLSGRLLWPGTVVDQNDIAIDWPGWELVNGVWVQIDDGLRPTMRVEFEVNPTVDAIVSYPPATPFCAAEPPPPAPPPPPARPAVPVPVDQPLALLLMLLSVLGVAWYTQRGRL
ncbi:beta strand repeat-containing protein [Marinihelvus fidelis]|nr:DUF11 domain-containing protein [Marinihelvus fidelis]